MEAFSLADQSRNSHPNSTYVSPRLMPSQQGLGLGQDMLLSQGMSVPGPEIFTSQPEQSYIPMTNMHARNMSVGQADKYAPPTINIEPAPVSRQASFGLQEESVPNALSPPTNTGSK